MCRFQLSSILLSALILAGCQSSVRQASHAANVIRETAQSSEARFGAIEQAVIASDLASIDTTAIAAHAAAGVQEQRRIQHLVGGLQETLTATQDRPSPWIGILQLWGWIALVVIGVIILAWFGLPPLVRRAIGV